MDIVEEGNKQIRSSTCCRLSRCSSHHHRRQLVKISPAHLLQQTTTRSHQRATQSINRQNLRRRSSWLLNELHAYSPTWSSTRILQPTPSYPIYYSPHYWGRTSQYSNNKWSSGAYNGLCLLCTKSSNAIYQEKLSPGEENQLYKVNAIDIPRQLIRVLAYMRISFC